MSAGDWLDAYPGVLRRTSRSRATASSASAARRSGSSPRATPRCSRELLRRCDDSGVAGDHARRRQQRADQRRRDSTDWWSATTIGGCAWSMSRASSSAAGCMMPRVALDCASRGIAGLEFGIGVPGTLRCERVRQRRRVRNRDGRTCSSTARALDPTATAVTLDGRRVRVRRTATRVSSTTCAATWWSVRGLRVHADDPTAFASEPTRSRRSAKRRSRTGFAASAASSRIRPATRPGGSIEAAGLEGTPRRRRADLPEARELHRQRRPRHCRRRARPSSSVAHDAVQRGSTSSSSARSSCSATTRTGERACLSALRVGVFFGSRSVEHEVSVITAQQAMAAMPADRIDPGPRVHREVGRVVHGRARCSSSTATRTSIG